MLTAKFDRMIENLFSCSKLDDVKELKNPRFSGSVQALLDGIKFSTPMHPTLVDSEKPAYSTQAKDSNLLNHLKNTLYS